MRQVGLSIECENVCHRITRRLPFVEFLNQHVSGGVEGCSYFCQTERDVRCGIVIFQFLRNGCGELRLCRLSEKHQRQQQHHGVKTFFHVRNNL